MLIRDRIKELRRVKASLLRPHPKNWRTHPTAQRDALRGVLAEIGYADALIARELPDGSLQLIDGHLRAEVTPEQEVPVLVVDLTDEEAAKLLAVHDPLAAMAAANQQMLAELLADVQTQSEAVQTLLEYTIRWLRWLLPTSKCLPNCWRTFRRKARPCKRCWTACCPASTPGRTARKMMLRRPM